MISNAKTKEKLKKSGGWDAFFDYYSSAFTVRRKPAAFMYEISIMLLKFSIALILSSFIRFTAKCVIHCLLILQRPKVFQRWRIILSKSKSCCNWEHISVVQADMQELFSYFSGWRRAFYLFIYIFFILAYSVNWFYLQPTLSCAFSSNKLKEDEVWWYPGGDQRFGAFPNHSSDPVLYSSHCSALSFSPEQLHRRVASSPLQPQLTG